MTSNQSNSAETNGDQPSLPKEDEPAILIDPVDVVDTVGEIAPAVLVAGVLIALLVFVMIVGGLIAVILNGGFGLIPVLRSDPITVDFSEPTNSLWQSSSQAEFVNGSFQMVSDSTDQLFWSTAGVDLGLGEYSVDITFEEIVADSGAGLMFLLSGDIGAESFYLFEIDPKGFVWIGRCEQGCLEATPITGGGWYTADAVNKGVGVSNRLKAVVRPTEMTFYLNGLEVGHVPNQQIGGWGDVGLLLEAGEEKGASAYFDNFTWEPFAE